MKLKIKQKFLAIILINIFSLLIIGLVGFIGVRKMNQAKNSLVANSRLLAALLPAQNLRDNIRGLIYRGSSMDISNEEEKKEIQKEFEAQVKGFQASIVNLSEVKISERFDTLSSRIIVKSKEFQDAAVTLLDKQVAGDFEAYTLIGSFVTIYDDLNLSMDVLSKEFDAANAELEEEGNDLAQKSSWGIALFASISLLVSLTINLNISSSIVKRIEKSKDIFTSVSSGIIPEKEMKTGSDEIGQMLTSLNSYIDSLYRTSEFAGEIGKGNFDHQFQSLSDGDKLGNSLIQMRDNLKRSSEEERKRNWATQGLAEIGTILRQQSGTIEELYINIIRFVVKYTKCNQGSLFLLNQGNSNEQYLQLAACYAWDKRKYVNKRIEVGEGMVGQCVLERQTVLMTNIPKDYIRITSGLGDALPAALLIVPLKVNDEIHGIMEIASFKKFESYEIEFIEKLAENIASAISTVRVNDRTKQLLAQSQQQGEEMRSQEEEMRQNMEELSATQEEMARKEKEYLRRIEELERSLHVSA